jgi:hypothetical protein
MIKIYFGLHVKYPVFLTDFYKTWIYWKYFRKKILKYKISQKSVQWKSSCSMRKDGRMDRQTDKHDQADIRCSHFFERDKNTWDWTICKVINNWGYQQQL